MTDERLIEIETALAHQERITEDLSEIVRGQAGRLDQLERALLELSERLEAAEARGGPEREKPPPHW